jgi:hypothetical protein
LIEETGRERERERERERGEIDFKGELAKTGMCV